MFRDVTDRFKDIEAQLQKRVVGQQNAIDAVARRLVLNKGPLKDGFDRPDGVLLFLGPTGVGKTELAKAVAEFLFGDEKKMIRVDMSEYQDGSVSVDKLIGMPRGIVGSERGGVLTNQLKDNPYCVVLLDEVEKASPNTLNLFLQAFDEGWMTDGRGKRVYLSDAVIIMTSNIGAENFRKLTSPLGFMQRSGRRRAGGGRGDARARTPLPAGVPQPHRRSRAVRAAHARRGARDREALPRSRSTLTLAKAGKTIADRRRGAGAGGGEGLQHGLRRAVPEALHRRAHQAADQRALEGRLALRRSARRTAS